jgi:hypothetical protein
MKQILLMIAVVALVGCGKEEEETWQKLEKPRDAPAFIADPIIEKAIRKDIKKPTGELTKGDLEKVTGLMPLYARNATMVFTEDLGKLTQLTTLHLRDNLWTEVPKELEKLTKLERLYLSSNHLTSVKGLEKLTKLEWLYLDFNELTSVKGLEKLTQLKTLYLNGNRDLTKSQIAELQKALPKCFIHRDQGK